MLEKLGSVKSSVDNKEPRGNIHLKIRAKDKATKNEQIEWVNRYNE